MMLKYKICAALTLTILKMLNSTTEYCSKTLVFSDIEVYPVFLRLTKTELGPFKL